MEKPTGTAELQAFTEHLAVAQGASPHTVAAYRADIQSFLTFIRGLKKPVPLAQLAPTHVAQWAESQALRHMAPRTTARRLTALRRFCAFCITRGWMVENPATLLPLPKIPQNLPKALTEKEVQALLQAPVGNTPPEQRLRLILNLLYASGIRVSELCNLSLADVEEGEGVILRVTGKGSKTRLVPLGPVAAATMQTYLTQGRAHLKGAHGGFVFAGPHGGPLSRQRMFQLVKEAGARVGVKVAPHHLRHTFATHLVQHDADLRSVQLMLGHASLNTTQIYTKVATDHLKTTLERFHPLNQSRRTSKS